MNPKHITIPLLLALAANLTTAAAPDSEPAASPDKPYNLHHLYRPDNLHTLSSAAPKPDNMDAPPALLPQPASTYDAATAAKTDITYTPYPSAKNIPANNGYRKILGETADGRLVIQDYYANSDAPRRTSSTATATRKPPSSSTPTANSSGTTRTAACTPSSTTMTASLPDT